MRQLQHDAIQFSVILGVHFEGRVLLRTQPLHAVFVKRADLVFIDRRVCLQPSVVTYLTVGLFEALQLHVIANPRDHWSRVARDEHWRPWF